MNYKYHNVNKWDSLISVDAILTEYNEDKSTILNLLEHNPAYLVKKIWHELLSIDHTCRIKKNHDDTDIFCINCHNMKLLLNDNPFGEPFKISTGHITGEYMIITETKVQSPHINWINKYKIKGDNFTMKILFTWYIEKYFQSLNIPAIQLKSGFICSNHGFLLYKAPIINDKLCNIDCLYDLDKQDLIDNIYGILSQFIVIYDALKSIHFLLGNSNQYSFLFDQHPCSYTYKNKLIKCQYTVYLADLSNSMVTINNVEYSVNTYVNDLIEDKFTNKLFVEKNNQYIIKDYNNLKFKHKLPISINFYSLLSSLLSDPYFIILINANPEALVLWKSLWPENYDEDLSNIWLYKNPTF